MVESRPSLLQPTRIITVVKRPSTLNRRLKQERPSGQGYEMSNNDAYYYSNTVSTLALATPSISS